MQCFMQQVVIATALLNDTPHSHSRRRNRAAPGQRPCTCNHCEPHSLHKEAQRGVPEGPAGCCGHVHSALPLGLTPGRPSECNGVLTIRLSRCVSAQRADCSPRRDGLFRQGLCNIIWHSLLRCAPPILSNNIRVPTGLESPHPPRPALPSSGCIPQAREEVPPGCEQKRRGDVQKGQACLRGHLHRRSNQRRGPEKGPAGESRSPYSNYSPGQAERQRAWNPYEAASGRGYDPRVHKAWSQRAEYYRVQEEEERVRQKARSEMDSAGRVVFIVLSAILLFPLFNALFATDEVERRRRYALQRATESRASLSAACVSRLSSRCTTTPSQARGVRTCPPTTDAAQRNAWAVRRPVCLPPPPLTAGWGDALRIVCSGCVPPPCCHFTSTLRSRPPRAVGEGDSKGHGWVWVHPYGWQWLPLDKIEQSRQAMQQQQQLQQQRVAKQIPMYVEEEPPHHPTSPGAPTRA